MPTIQRRSLRQRLGRDFIFDTYVGTTTSSLPANTGSAYVMDPARANLAHSGQQQFKDHWLLIRDMELRVASFNFGSGAYVTLQTIGTGIASGGQYERHAKLSPADKDRAIDHMLARARVRREVGLPTVDGALVYTIDAVASPHRIVDILDVYVLTSPTATGSRERGRFVSNSVWQIDHTATGRILRVPFGSGLGASQQIVLDALLHLTLGASSDATLDLPDDVAEEWLLSGAAIQCWSQLIGENPRANTEYKDLRQAEVRRFSRLSAANAPQIDRPLRFEEPI